MKKELAQDICLCNENFKLYENYSGRGMLGEATTGVTCDSLMELLNCVIANAEVFIDIHGEYVKYDKPNLFCDNMGKGFIIY